MPYIGTDINYGNIAKQTGTGDGSDTTPIAALTYTVPSNESILVFLDGVAQVPGTDFTATGTTLTFTTAPALGVAILVMFLGRSLDIGTPGDGTVSLAKMAVNSIDSDQYVDGSIDAVHLSANSVDSDAYVDGSIDLAHMSSESVDEDNLHISNSGSNGEFLSKQSGDAGGLTWAAAGGGLTEGTNVATTSGANIPFTGIPSGTTLIYVMFEGVSMSGTNNMLVQIGDSGGIETSGYVQDTAVSVNGAGTVSGISAGAGAPMATGVHGAGMAVTGFMAISRKNAATYNWVFSHSLVVFGYNVYRASMGGAAKSLSAELTQLVIDNNGSDTFDAGSANISYM